MTGPADLPPAGVQPEEAIAFFRSKGYKIGFSWQDVFKGEHVKWFTVAKAMSRSVLEDIREAVDDAIANGTTLADFKKTLRPKLEAKGWWGKKRMIDPATGRHETVQLGSPRRLKTIFDTNLRTAYAAGKWERIERTKSAFPFLEYSAVLDGRERPQHHAWSGTILRADDPWWETHYPPCAWNCRCTVVQRSQRMLDRQGKTVTEEPVAFDEVPWTNTRTGETGMIEKGLDKGWDYNVGKEYLRGLAPSPLPESFDGPEEVGASAMFTTGQSALVDRFLAAFGVDHGKEAIWNDRDGWPIAIGASWFIGADGSVRIPGRGGAAGIAMDRISAAIVTPDKIDWIWVKGDDGRALLMRRYGRTAAGIVTSVEVGGIGWRWTIKPAA
ncbi:MAG: phage minor head protein [Sphingomonas sp.]